MQAVGYDRKLVKHLHGVGQQLLRLQIGVRVCVRAAIGRHHVVQSQGERRLTVVRGVPVSRNLLVLQIGVLGDFVQVEVYALAGHPRKSDVGRGNGDIDGVLHAIAQQAAQCGTDAGDCQKGAHVESLNTSGGRCIASAARARQTRAPAACAGLENAQAALPVRPEQSRCCRFPPRPRWVPGSRQASPRRAVLPLAEARAAHPPGFRRSVRSAPESSRLPIWSRGFHGPSAEGPRAPRSC